MKFSTSFKLNEIHTVDNPYNDDHKNINFFQRGPNFGGGTAGKFRENGQLQGRLLPLCNFGGGEFRKSTSTPTPGTKILVISIFPHARPIFS